MLVSLTPWRDDAVWAEVHRLFDMDYEISLPTVHQTLLWAFAAVLAGLIAQRKGQQKGKKYDKWTPYWWGLMGLFIYFCFDEGASIHETLGLIPERLGVSWAIAEGTGGAVMYNWYLVLVPILMLVGVFFVRFWWNLPKRTKWLLVLAGTIYVVGAIGMEMMASKVLYAGEEVVPAIMSGMEEILEAIGESLLVWTLMDYWVLTFDKKRDKI